MSIYVISYITDSIKCCIKRLIFLILRAVLYCILEIIKLILIMAAVYAIAQLLYIAWERYIEKHVLSEFKILNNVSKLTSIQSIQYRSAISQSSCSVHSINGPISSETDTRESDVPIKIEKDTQTPEDLMPIKIIYSKQAEKEEKLEVPISKAETVESVEELDFEEAELSNISQQISQTVDKPIKQPIKRLFDKEMTTQKKARKEYDTNQNKMESFSTKQPYTSSEKETAEEDPGIEHRRRRKRKHLSLRYNPIKTFYENTSSEERANEKYSKEKFSLKPRSKQEGSLEELDLLNTPIRIENYVKRDSSPIYPREVSRESKGLRKKSSTKFNEGLVQRDERQINKIAYAKRSSAK